MSVAVVDLLEMIEVDQRERQRRAAPLGCAEQPRHHRIEIAAVEQLRQRIVDRLDGELRLQRLDLDHLVLQVGVEPFELGIHPLGLLALGKRAIALGTRMLELVLDAQQEVLGAGAIATAARSGRRAACANPRRPPGSRRLRRGARRAATRPCIRREGSGAAPPLRPRPAAAKARARDRPAHRRRRRRPSRRPLR